MTHIRSSSTRQAETREQARPGGICRQPLPTAERIQLRRPPPLRRRGAACYLFVSSDRSSEVKTMMSTTAIVATLACAAALSGCNSEQTSSQSAGQSAGATKSYTFGLANQQESVTFPPALAKGAKAKAAERGVKIV